MSSDLAHIIPKEGRRRLLVSLLTVIALHALLLLMPSVRKEVLPGVERNPLAVRLVAERTDTERESGVPPGSAADGRSQTGFASPEPLSRDPAVTIPQAAEPGGREDREAEAIPDRHAAPALLTRIMSSPYLDEDPPRLEPFPEDFDPKLSSVEFRFADRSTPDPLIHPQSVRLPFADAPRFAVEFYDDGVMGSVQRFWDSVTFAKTWTTKNGTRVSCGVVLVIPACAWD